MSDVLTVATIDDAIELLQNSSVATSDGFYVVHVHPDTLAQLKMFTVRRLVIRSTRKGRKFVLVSENFLAERRNVIVRSSRHNN